MDAQDNTTKKTTGLNLDSQTSHGENDMSSIPSSGDQFSVAPGNAEQDSQATPLSELAQKQFAHIMEVQKSYARALLDPDQITAGLLFHQSVQDLKNNYGRDVLVEYYGDNPEHSDTSVLRPYRPASFGSSQTRLLPGGMMENVHSSSRGLDNMSPHLQQQQIVPPGSNTMRLICIKGQVPNFCVDPHGSRFIQQALEVATPREIGMVYEEIMPVVHTLAVDVFANHALQKLLEYGPQYYQREFINRLTGHVFALSLHMHGCWVIQKAFVVGELDQKVQMAKELDGKIVRCVRDPYGNRVIQKCMGCVPPRHVQFMFRSFYGKTKALSMDPYGCHVMQKALAFCSIPEIYHSLSSEIVEAANELSLDQFGSCVVQHMLLHGCPAVRSTMVSKFAGRIVSMSCHKFGSNIVDKCLAFGSNQDRRLITDEIVSAGQQLEHLVEMMTDPYGSLVMEKLVATAEEESKVAVLVDVARSNLATLTTSPHGRLVVAGIERRRQRLFAGTQVRLAPPLPPQ